MGGSIYSGVSYPPPLPPNPSWPSLGHRAEAADDSPMAQIGLRWPTDIAQDSEIIKIYKGFEAPTRKIFLAFLERKVRQYEYAQLNHNLRGTYNAKDFRAEVAKLLQSLSPVQTEAYRKFLGLGGGVGTEAEAYLLANLPALNTGSASYLASIFDNAKLPLTIKQIKELGPLLREVGIIQERNANILQEKIFIVDHVALWGLHHPSKENFEETMLALGLAGHNDAVIKTSHAGVITNYLRLLAGKPEKYEGARMLQELIRIQANLTPSEQTAIVVMTLLAENSPLLKGLSAENKHLLWQQAHYQKNYIAELEGYAQEFAKKGVENINLKDHPALSNYLNHAYQRMGEHDFCQQKISLTELWGVVYRHRSFAKAQTVPAWPSDEINGRQQIAEFLYAKGRYKMFNLEAPTQPYKFLFQNTNNVIVQELYYSLHGAGTLECMSGAKNVAGMETTSSEWSSSKTVMVPKGKSIEAYLREYINFDAGEIFIVGTKGDSMYSNRSDHFGLIVPLVNGELVVLEFSSRGFRAVPCAVFFRNLNGPSLAFRQVPQPLAENGQKCIAMRE